MGSKTTTQTTTIPGRSGQENNLLTLLTQLANSGALQLGDLSALAGGQVGSPTGADQALIAQSIGRAAQAAQSNMRTSGQLTEAQAREGLIGRGQTGGSAETVSALLNALGTQQGINQSILGAQQAGGQALLNLPFQRGAMQLQANQELFNRILGAGGAGLQYGLQERVAQPTTSETTSGFDLDDLASLGSLLGGLNLGSLGSILGGGGGLPPFAPFLLF